MPHHPDPGSTPVLRAFPPSGGTHRSILGTLPNHATCSLGGSPAQTYPVDLVAHFNCA